MKKLTTMQTSLVNVMFFASCIFPDTGEDAQMWFPTRYLAHALDTKFQGYHYRALDELAQAGWVRKLSTDGHNLYTLTTAAQQELKRRMSGNESGGITLLNKDQEEI